MISFYQSFGTKMPCLEGMDTEQELINALQETTNFKLSGEKLELYDNSMFGRFEAVCS